jgi:DNA end-binding protein Ku
MARPIWNGTISFGLLNVPVQLHSGEHSVDLHLRMLDSRTKTPIRYERVNSETGKEVPWKDIVKAFEYSKGNYVVLDEADIRKAHPEATESVEIEAFVETESIDIRYFERPYYLVPAKKAEKGYVLLREVLKKTGRAGIAKVVIRTRQYLAALVPFENALLLNLLRFPQEIIDPEEFNLPAEAPARYRIAPREMEMAEALVASMATKWNPADYKDDFRAKLRKIIDAQIAADGGKEPKTEKPKAIPGATTNVVDFMSLLRKSLDKEGGKKRPRATRAAAGKRRKAG